MSYILEALKKSEKERQRGTVPDLLSSQDAILQKPQKRLLWPYLILIALLLNSGLLGLWLIHLQSKKQPVVVHSTTVQQHESKGAEILSSSQVGSELKSEPSEQKPAEHHQRVQTKTDLQRKTQDDQMPISEQKPDNKSMTVIENKVYTLNELPVSIKQSLPAFSISVFLYS